MRKRKRWKERKRESAREKKRNRETACSLCRSNCYGHYRFVDLLPRPQQWWCCLSSSPYFSAAFISGGCGPGRGALTLSMTTGHNLNPPVSRLNACSPSPYLCVLSSQPLLHQPRSTGTDFSQSEYWAPVLTDVSTSIERKSDGEIHLFTALKDPITFWEKNTGHRSPVGSWL